MRVCLKAQEFMNWLNHTNPGIDRGAITAEETPDMIIAVLKVGNMKVATSYIRMYEIARHDPKQFAMEKAKELVEWYKSIKETDNGR